MKKSHKKKHIVYYEMIEAFRTARTCPLCFLEERDAHRYMENLLYEKVNSVALRGKLIRSRGFCRRHAHMLLEFGNGLGTAILYRDQVRAFLDFLKDRTKPTARITKRTIPESWSHDSLCPACTALARMRQVYLNTFLEWINDDNFRAALEQSNGLCVPHLLLILRKTRDPSLHKYLIAEHIEKYSALLKELNEYIRKTDYRYKHEKRGREKDAWKRAVNLLAGAENSL